MAVSSEHDDGEVVAVAVAVTVAVTVAVAVAAAGGQVFQARWRDEVIAAKLVPFMSLVAHHHHLPVTLTSAVPAAAATAAGTAASNPQAAALDNPPFSAAATGHNDDLMMGLGMKYSAAALKAIKMEIRVLSQLCHPHIIAFKGACLAPPHICILEELAEGGSLWSRLHSRSSRRHLPPGAAGPAARRQPPPGSSAQGTPPARDSMQGQQQQRPRRSLSDPSGAGAGRGQLPPPLCVHEVLSIACDVASAMHYLHTLQPQVVHRDLKPQNVLLDQQGRAKVWGTSYNQAHYCCLMLLA
jgi:serine/threonine protein kinase